MSKNHSLFEKAYDQSERTEINQERIRNAHKKKSNIKKKNVTKIEKKNLTKS
jgi:hypothetical protein